MACPEARAHYPQATAFRCTTVMLASPRRGLGKPSSWGMANWRMAKRKTRLYRPGEVLKRAGISRQVLYRYLQLELVTPAEVTETGRNLFTESVFKQIQMIQGLNKSGYTLRDIREIFSERLRKLK